ncbi:hypothetical protein Hanom_Chr00s000001g01592971 [Helianthus anomalus]
MVLEIITTTTCAATDVACLRHKSTSPARAPSPPSSDILFVGDSSSINIIIFLEQKRRIKPISYQRPVG